MSDAEFIKIEIKTSVLELCAIVTPNMLDLHIIIRHGPVRESPEDILHFSFVRDDMHQV
jgi:hypothetical protein